MDAKLRYVEIKKLFGQYDVEWNIDKDTTVLVGQNGSGKTTILRILEAVLLKDTDDDLLRDIASLMSVCKLKFSNSAELVISCDHLNEETQSQFLSFLKSRFVKQQNETIVSDAELHKLSKQFDNMKLLHVITANNNGIKINGICIELISTLNLSANALNNVEIGDGTDLNVLDIQIERAITSFQKLKEQESYSEIKAKVISVLNDFFSTTQKTIELSDTDFVIKNLKKEVLKLSQLSAGERQIIYIVFKVATAYFNEALILMDEPEISLHLEWQEKLLKNLREINDKSQMIVVTHSPAIVMDGWMDSYVDIQTILKPIKDDE